MPESCSDLGAERQVTERWTLVRIAPNLPWVLLDEPEPGLVEKGYEVVEVVPARRVEELEAALRGVLECVDGAQAVDAGVMNLYGGEPLVIQKARALLKEGEKA